MALVLYFFLCSFFSMSQAFSSCVMWFSASVGAELCSFFWFTLAYGWVCFWPAVSGAYVGCAVCTVSAALSSWVSFCSDCPAPALAVQVVYSQSFVPSCCSCGLNSLGVSAAAFCPLGLLSHSFLLLFLTWVSSFGIVQAWVSGAVVLFLVPPFFCERLSFPCPCCFSLTFTTLLFSPGDLGSLDFFLDFQCCWLLGVVCASVALPSGWVSGAAMLSFHFLVSTWSGLCSSACVRYGGSPSLKN